MQMGTYSTSAMNTKLTGFDCLLTKLKKLLPKCSSDLDEIIFKSIGFEESSHFAYALLSQCSEYVYKPSYNSCLKSSEIVLDYAWEKLNSYHWKDVPTEWQKVYSYGCMFKAWSLAGNSSNRDKICQVCDMGLLMGHDIMNGILHQIIDLFKPDIVPLMEKSAVEESTPQPAPPLLNKVSVLNCPSLEMFSLKMQKERPFIVESCIEHWPARRIWSFPYLNEIAGHRLVPVELGSKYTDDSWGQNLMTISDFIKHHIISSNAEKKAYLAQHRLFDQIPALRNDIYIPDYCSISNLDDCNPEVDTEINAWFGPQGTISPCHYDIKHNLLTQVVGRKYIRLYSQACSSSLYPHEDLLNNTSKVDVENPDFRKFPLFDGMDAVSREDCILHPGQMLYIPPKYWHYIRSMDESFSVSFWWN